jgi:hypothetical protein
MYRTRLPYLKFLSQLCQQNSLYVCVFQFFKGFDRPTSLFANTLISFFEWRPLIQCCASNLFQERNKLEYVLTQLLTFTLIMALPYIMISLYFLRFRFFYFFVELTPHVFLHLERECSLCNRKTGRSTLGSITRQREGLEPLISGNHTHFVAQYNVSLLSTYDSLTEPCGI